MRNDQPLASSSNISQVQSPAANSLFLLGSPYFDGIGILYEEARRELRKGSRVFLLDAVEPGLYPDVKNFTLRATIAWRAWRRRQFLKGLERSHYHRLRPLLSPAGRQRSDDPEIMTIARQTLYDHAVCYGVGDVDRSSFVESRLDATIESYGRIRAALCQYLDRNGTTRVFMFNGRNPVARLLQSICIDRGIEMFFLELFGKRDGQTTYIRLPFDVFDMDRLGDWIRDAYLAAGPERDAIAQSTLEDRIENLDPLLLSWNVEGGTKGAADAPFAAETKPLVSFFFSSEDEYPALKPSRYGLPDPTRQYDTFRQICRGLAERGLLNAYRWEMKLHPRYLAESDKLAAGNLAWKAAIQDIRAMGMDIEVQSPTASPYALIARSALVVSYGSTAWEACYLGKPAILLGPGPFGSHDCAYSARDVEAVLNLIADIPPPKPREHAYPYAWSWSQIGILPEIPLSTTKPVGLRNKLTVALRNRFTC